jgi:signal transduction histidine kinase
MKSMSIVSRLGMVVAALVIGQALLFMVLGGAAFRSQAFPARMQIVDNTMVLLRIIALPGRADDNVQSRLARLSEVPGFALGLYDTDGHLLQVTREGVGIESQLAPDRMEQARRLDGHALLFRGSIPTQTSMAVATLPAGSGAAFLAFAESNTPQRLTRGIAAIFIAQIFGVVVVTLLITAWLVARTRRSLAEIENVVGRMADGDLAKRLPIRGDDEVARVAASFNRMADTLADRIAQLRRIEAQRTRMFAAFTHEISTPLTSVLGYLESLRLSEIADDPTTRQRYIEIAYTQARSLDALAEDLSILSRLEFEGIVLNRRPLDLSTWGRAEIEPFQVRGKTRGVSFQLDVLQPVIADVDAQRLGQVLRIFLDNALRHTRENSLITVTIRADDDWIQIETRDQGAGISAEQLERLGEPLHRVDPSRSRDTGGRGLGLSIASGLVKAHGGSLFFDSPAGSGLVVTVRLPRCY